MDGPPCHIFKITVCRYKQQENAKVMAAHAIAVLVHAIHTCSEEQIKAIHEALQSSGAFQGRTSNAIVNQAAQAIRSLEHTVKTCHQA